MANDLYERSKDYSMGSWINQLTILEKVWGRSLRVNCTYFAIVSDCIVNAIKSVLNSFLAQSSVIFLNFSILSFKEIFKQRTTFSMGKDGRISDDLPLAKKTIV